MGGLSGAHGNAWPQWRADSASECVSRLVLSVHVPCMVSSVKNMLLESGMAEEAELKAVEKKARADVTAAIKEAKKGPVPPVLLLAPLSPRCENGSSRAH